MKNTISKSSKETINIFCLFIFDIIQEKILKIKYFYADIYDRIGISVFEYNFFQGDDYGILSFTYTYRI